MHAGYLDLPLLTPDEAGLLGHVTGSGEVQGPFRNVIRGDLIAQLVTGTGPIGSTVPRWRRWVFQGINVLDGLDLADSTVAGSVLFSDCFLVGQPLALNLNGAMLGELRLSGCMLVGGVQGSNAQVLKNVFVMDSVFDGPVSLTFGDVGGSVSLFDSEFNGQGVSLEMDGIRVAGALQLAGLDVIGSLALRDSHLKSQSYIRDLEVGMGGTFSAITLRNTVVESELTIEKVKADRLDIAGMTSDSDIILKSISSRDRKSGSILADRMRVRGGVLVAGCELGLGLSISGSRLGSLEVRSSALRSKAFVNSYSLADFESARSEHVRCLSGDGLRVDGDVKLGPLLALSGETRLIGSDVGGQIQMVGKETPWILNFEDMTVRSSIFLDAIHPKTQLNLASSRVGGIFIDASGFPKSSFLRTTYAQINSGRGDAITADQGAAMLENSLTGVSIAPYRVLARWLRSQGDDKGYTQLSIHGEAAVRTSPKRRHRFASWFLRWTVGYGFAPLRALWWLAGLVALGTIVSSVIYWGTIDFSAFGNPAFAADTSELPFNPLAYAIAAAIPGAPAILGAWVPGNPGTQILTILLQGAGWVLVTTVAAGLVNRLRRD